MHFTVPAHDHAQLSASLIIMSRTVEVCMYFVTRGQFPGWVVHVLTKISGHKLGYCMVKDPELGSTTNFLFPSYVV